MKPSDFLAVSAGFLVGDYVSEEFEPNHRLTGLATGLVVGGLTSSIVADIMEETGVDEVLNDVFGINSL